MSFYSSQLFLLDSTTNKISSALQIDRELEKLQQDLVHASNRSNPLQYSKEKTSEFQYNKNNL